MREIKFRAWDAYRKRIYEVIEINWLGESIKVYADFAGYGYTNMKSAILMQYTGLHDEGGKEIYEGDILGCHDNVKRWKSGDGERAIVEWDKNKSRWGMMFHSIYGGEGHLCAEESLNSRVRFEWVVVGNIYENPELLELGSSHDKIV